MDSLEQKLNEILSSPEKLEQIMKFAGEFLGSAGNAGTSAGSAEPSPVNAAGENAASGAASPLALMSMPGGGKGEAAPASTDAGGANPLSALLGMLGGSGGAAAPASASASAPAGGSNPLGGLDPKLMSTALQVLGALGQDDDRTRLLRALKPHLRSERAERLDRAVQILRVSGAIRAAIHSFSGGDKKDV